MTPGLSKDIWCHVGPYSSLCLQITKSESRAHVTVSLVIADRQLNLPQGFMWVCTMYALTYSLYFHPHRQQDNILKKETTL